MPAILCIVNLISIELNDDLVYNIHDFFIFLFTKALIIYCGSFIIFLKSIHRIINFVLLFIIIGLKSVLIILFYCFYSVV